MELILAFISGILLTAAAVWILRSRLLIKTDDTAAIHLRSLENERNQLVVHRNQLIAELGEVKGGFNAAVKQLEETKHEWQIQSELASAAREEVAKLAEMLRASDNKLIAQKRDLEETDRRMRLEFKSLAVSIL